MTSDEFAKNFYLEKLAFLKSCFQAQPEQPSAVNVKIKEMALTAHQTEKLKEVIDILLDDVFYTILLGLDGESPIAKTIILFPIVENWKPVLMNTFMKVNTKKKAIKF